jgi:HAD superfamily hydrolase (TIGR01450 family)
MTSPLSSFRTWLFSHADEIDALLLDVDGVLMTSRHPLPGSVDLVAELRDRGFPFLLLTNDGCNSPAEKVAYLEHGGLSFAVDELVSSSHALEELVQEKQWQGDTFFVMGELGDPCYARDAGLQTTRDLKTLANGDCHGVLVGEKSYDWEHVIAGVFNFLVRQPHAPVVVPNPDVYFPVKGGRLHPASGATVGFVQFLCRTHGFEIDPVFLGKPYAPIFRHAQHVVEKRLGHAVPPDRLFMLGDSLASDIRGGRDAGLRTGLMLTGITTPDTLAASDIQPDLVFSAL